MSNTLAFWQLLIAVSIGPAFTLLIVLFGVWMNNRYIDAKVEALRQELMGELKLHKVLLDILLKKFDELEAKK